MREGVFPVWPRDGCPEHCDFQGICWFAEWRLRRKWEAHPIGLLASLAEEDEETDEEDAA